MTLIKRGRGRPPGSKNKATKQSSAKQSSAKRVASLNKQNMITENNALADRLDDLELQILDYKHKEIGYRAVISYLQAKIDGNAEL